ncbi:MAG: 4-alpha-glucanotransferase, partial [Chloroflexota bacterium]|nr:4-alpha-glucanotransferase [Chloroflexota bacterium]
MQLQRASGLLLHPTSLPGPHGVGDFGPEARRFLRFLEDAGQRAWQVLPLGPVGAGNSPYASYSAFAGEPLLISPDRLLDAGLLHPDDLEGGPEHSGGRVAYEDTRTRKLNLLRRARARFPGSAAFEAFQECEAAWLQDYALFVALKGAHNGDAWYTWGADLAAREPTALERVRRELAGEIHFHSWV